jgi:hypothetical protein
VKYRQACGKLLGGFVSLIKRKLEEVAEALLEYLFPDGGYDDRWKDYAYAAAEKMIDSEEVPEVLR